MLGVMNRRMWLAAVVLSLTAVFTIGSTQATAQPMRPITIHETFPLAMVVPNECNGDIVTLEGDMSVFFHLTQTPNAGFHNKTQVRMKGQGVGVPSGRKYTFSNITHSSFNTPGGFPIVSSFDLNQRLVTPGRENNAILRNHFHFTINANGELTSEVGDFQTECQ